MVYKTRTEYSARNTAFAVASRIAAIFMGYIVRIVFTHMLSESYVGLNGLFMDIINVLSLSEMGIETAILYALYKPVAHNDIEKQKSIMKLYCRFYRIVGLFITAAGIAFIPFIKYIAKNNTGIQHFTLIYMLYLLNTALSYIFVYKRTLIEANQLNYICTIYQTSWWIVQDVLQIIVLILTKNFILFLVVYIMCTLLGNVLISRKADSMYPFLKDKDIQPLNRAEKKDILKNIKALMMHKIGDVVVNNTDNLLLSYFMGIVSVAKYSNYFLLIGSIRQIIDQMFQGITASVGNLGVLESNERVEEVYEASFFIGQWLYGFAAICLFELLNPFVSISFGNKYVFSKDIVLILCINFFVVGMNRAARVFRDSLGLFWFDRYKPLAESLVNITVSIVLAKLCGTAGVFIGTFVSTITTTTWLEPYILYKHKINKKCKRYFVKYCIYTIIICAVWYLTDILCTFAAGNTVINMIETFAICALFPNMLLTVAYCRTKEFKFVYKKIINIIKR